MGVTAGVMTGEGVVAAISGGVSFLCRICQISQPVTINKSTASAEPKARAGDFSQGEVRNCC